MRVYRLLVLLCVPLTAACGGSGSPTAPTPQQTRTIGLSGNLAFGNAVVGTTQTATLTISNSGNSTLTVTGMTGPRGFSASWTSGPIAAGGSQLVTIGFTPTSAGNHGGTITVNADHTGGTNTISVSGTAHPNMLGAWFGTLTITIPGISNVCNMSWIANGQTGGQFSGTFQTSGGTTTSCGQAGTFSANVSPANSVSNLSFGISVGAASNCTRLAGDGMFNGALSGATLTAQTADTVQCGTLAANRSLTVVMTKQ